MSLIHDPTPMKPAGRWSFGARTSPDSGGFAICASAGAPREARIAAYFSGCEDPHPSPPPEYRERGKEERCRRGKSTFVSLARRHAPRRGYVLVVTLGLLVLSATLLVAVGRTAQQHALAAKLAGDELQRRWGAASCRVAVLPFAEQTLVTAERQRNAAVPALRVTVPLGGQSFHLMVSDEQAKANVNALLDTVDKSVVENRVRQALRGSGLGNSVRLRPAKLGSPLPASRPASDAAARDDARPWLTGLGQVFDDLPPERLLHGVGPAPVDSLTCWGNGSINVMRVSQASLELACSPPMTKLQIERVLAARDAELRPTATNQHMSAISSSDGTPVNFSNLDPMSRLLAEAQVQVKERASLGLGNQSHCHSLWVSVEDSRRTWYELHILDESDIKHPRVISFVW